MSEQVNDYLQTEFGVDLGLSDDDLANIGLTASVAVEGYILYRFATLPDLSDNRCML